MALQGDLSSFALPDVLRLLAATAKTGRLAVDGGRSTGEVWVRDGNLVGGSVTTAPHASKAADLVFELLRFDGGSFVFDDADQLVDAGEPASVETAILAAEELAAEWAAVEQIVPSMQSVVRFAPEVSGDEVVVTSKQWKVLAALGAGRTVEELGGHFEQTDLAVSRRIKALVEAHLVELGEPEPAAEEAPSTDAVEDPSTVFEDEAPAEADAVPDDGMSVNEAYARDLALLSAEDGPVVLESRDDAHLPEPLPGEGTSFVGDLGTMGTVDGRSFEAIEAEAAAAAPALGEAEVHDPAAWTSFGSVEQTPLESVPTYVDEPAVEADPVEAFDPTALTIEPVVPGAERGWGDAPSDEAEPVADEESSPVEAESSDDRGSLLKFLSSVKP
ncbi:hypothetical protein BH10ACT1_BH10ACT1_24380 [soil metagenome]